MYIPSIINYIPSINAAQEYYPDMRYVIVYVLTFPQSGCKAFITNLIFFSALNLIS